METKNAIRKRALLVRDGISRERRQRLTDILTQKVICGREYDRADKLLVYAGFGSEVSTAAILQHALATGKEVFLPKILPERKMEFYPIRSMEDVMIGKWKIPEPLVRDNPPFSFHPEDRILMLMPLVAFDEERNRIGHGAGYYDRYLANMPSFFYDMTVGLAFELQKADGIPAEPTDIKPGKIITESQIYTISSCKGGR